MNQSEITWSRNLFDSLNLKGRWGVPRSGLIFEKTSEDTFTLMEVMPWTAEMGVAAKMGADVPADEKALREWQKADFETIRKRFVAAGIKVESGAIFS